MRRVLYVCTVSSRINNYHISKIEMLIKNGYRVECACSIDEPVNKQLLAKGVKVYEIPFKNKIWSSNNIKIYSKLAELQRINNYDIIHVHGSLASIDVRLLKLKFPKVKIIYTAYGYKFNKTVKLLRAARVEYLMEKILASFTDVIININIEDYRITKRKFNPPACYCISELCDDNSAEVNEYVMNKLYKVYKSLGGGSIFEKSKTAHLAHK